MNRFRLFRSLSILLTDTYGFVVYIVDGGFTPGVRTWVCVRVCTCVCVRVHVQEGIG